MAKAARREPKDPFEVLEAFVEKADTLEDDVYVGIDPGADGAIAFICGKLNCVVDIPTSKVGRKRIKHLNEKEQKKTGKKTKTTMGTKTLYDYDAIVELFRLVRPVKDRIFVCLEEAQVQIKGKGSNAYTGYRVGVGYGIWPLYLTSRGWPKNEVTPTVWKKRMGLHTLKGEKQNLAKERSRRKALSIFPKADISLKKDHNRAEALLLAEFERREREGFKPKRASRNPRRKN
jgi:hypothetical protein